MKPWREWPLTLCLIAVVFIAGLLASCRLLPLKQLPVYTGTAELNPYLPPALITNVLAVPMPGGGSVPVMTNVTRIRPAVMSLAVQPPHPVTNTLSVDMPLPANDDHLGRPEFLQVQSSTDFKTWKTIGQIGRTNATRTIRNLQATNPATFYRTQQTNDWLPPVVLPPNGQTIGR